MNWKKIAFGSLLNNFTSRGEKNKLHVLPCWYLLRCSCWQNSLIIKCLFAHLTKSKSLAGFSYIILSWPKSIFPMYLPNTFVPLFLSPNAPPVAENVFLYFGEGSFNLKLKSCASDPSTHSSSDLRNAK